MRYVLSLVMLFFAFQQSVIAQRDSTEIDKMAAVKGITSEIGENNTNLDDKVFDKKRTAQVKAENLQRKEDLKVSVSKGKEVINDAKSKITLAKDLLAKDKKTNKISREEYTSRKVTIELAEEKTKKLEQQIRRSEAQVKKK